MATSLAVKAIRTPIFHPRDDLASFVANSLAASDCGSLENSVLVVTSKIVSLAEGRVIPKNQIAKEALVRQEADQFLGPMSYGSYLTIKEGLLMASAGIDESNAEDDFYILYPKDPFASAALIHRELCRVFGLKNFGLILSDSRTSPLRKGVTGISLAHFGFQGIEDKVGTADLFGNKLKMTQINVADALAISAVFCMGESDESTPLALVRSDVRFNNESVEHYRQECRVLPQADLYWPFLEKFL